MRSVFWRPPAPAQWHCLPLLCGLLLLALAAPICAQTPDGFMLTNEIRNARGRLQWERRDLSPRQLDQLAYMVGRSNYLARAIETTLMQNNFTNAEGLLKEFSGTIDDVGRNYGMGGMLHQAAQNGPEELVAFLLAHKADPNRTGPHTEPPLMAAVRSQHWTSAQRLLEAGANASATNSQGQTILEVLLQSWWGPRPGTDPRLEFVLALLNHGADPFTPTKATFYYNTPYSGSTRGPAPLSALELSLTRAPWQYDVTTDLMLTNRPSPLRRTPSGQTALHLATVWGRTNVMQVLLDAGFSPNLTNGLGLTPLQLLTDSTPPQFGAARPGSAPGPRFMRGPFSGFSSMGPAPQPSTTDTAQFLLKHGATLDLFSAAGLGRTNELATMLNSNRTLVSLRDGCGRTPLHYAASSLQLGTARLLLVSGAAVDATNACPIPQRGNEAPLPAGLTPLHLAVRRNSAELVEMLLKAGAPVSPADELGDTPLHLAARGGPTNIVGLLLGAHAALDRTNQLSQTPLHEAAAYGPAGNLELLLQAHANPTYGLGSNTLVHLAAEHGNVLSLTVLLRHGFSVNARDAQGRTPLELALNSRSWDALNLLRTKGASLNAQDLQGNTPLHLAATMQDDSVNHMSEQSLWVKWKRDWMTGGGLRGQTINKFIQWKLVSAPPGPTWTNTSLMAWLLQYGANPNLTNRAGQTPLYVFCGQPWQMYTDPRPTNRLSALLRAGARVELRDTNGLTCLHVAATNASPAVIKLLARQVQHPEAFRDAQGATPVHYAARGVNNGFEDHGARLSALLASGLSPDTPDNQGRTPLHDALATYNSHGWRQDDFLLILLTNRANPNLQDAQGLTPLHVAIQAMVENPNYDLHEVCLLLLTNRVQLNLRDRTGRTPLHLLAGMSGPWAHPGGKFDDLLLTNKWDFAARDSAGQTPIHLWCSNLDTGCSACGGLLAAILTNKSLVNLTNGAGDTPLHVAIRANHPYTVAILLRAGADPGGRNARGETAYRAAIEQWDPYWRPECQLGPAGVNATLFNSINMRDRHSFDLWLQADPSLCNVTNSAGETALQAATARKLTDFAERLIELGAPLDLLSALRLDYMKDFHQLLAKHQGPVPPEWLFEALDYHREEATHDLVAAGGNARAVDGAGHSLAYRARAARLSELEAWLRQQGSSDTLFDAVTDDDRELLEKFLAADPANINATNAQARTPLLVAVAAGKEDLASYLLAHGADARSHTPEGWTALHLAVAKDLLPTAQLLLHAGADPNHLAVQGMGPLHLAATLGRIEFAELLLTNGADVNLCPPEQGGGFRNSPLHWAAQRGGPEMVKLLLAHGADPLATNNQGYTPARLLEPAHRGFLMWFPMPWEAPHRPPRMLTDAERAQSLELLKAAEARASTASAH